MKNDGFEYFTSRKKVLPKSGIREAGLMRYPVTSAGWQSCVPAFRSVT